ncbi:zinc finger CCCH domain-containing protein 19 [Neltuma alba]|uniref:zinc finger CCCH domain-containing protein 19 n=1 Tax=Neltuma alba TaxID=207710 RepID=UPI0010A58ACF|nr:zinc finger CCCH domain-containing protein 19-like [Prosopis alba]
MTNPAEDPPSPSRCIPPLLEPATVEDMPLARRDDADGAKTLLHCDEAEEKPSSPPIPPAPREVSEEISVADIAVVTKKLEEEAGEAVGSNENEEADKVAIGMESKDAYAACSLGETTETVEAWKVEEETDAADIAEDIKKAEEEANLAYIEEDMTRAEEEANVANIDEDITKVEEETDVANIAEDNKKVEEKTDVAHIADDNTKVEEETNVDNIAEDITKVKEDADVADIVEVEEDEAASSYEKEEAGKVVARTEPADTFVACSLGETTEMVEIREVDEEADEDGMPDENEEAEKVAVGMEMEDGSVASTLGETTEADKLGTEAEDKEEAAEVLNVMGTMEGTTDTEEDADGVGGREEALEAEEMGVANEGDLMEEDVDAAEVAEYAGGAELTEEMEVAEEQGSSISSAKRKRGKSSKSAVKVPVRKKVEEDVCFICFDGGELVLCDRRGCPKAYHPTCVNRDDAFFRAKGKWNCGWHLCSNCGKSSYYMCYTCTFSLCKGCIKDAVIFCVRGKNGFCETCMRTVMLIEQNELGNKDMGQVDFDDKSSWEYLFKDYYTDLKGKLSLTYDELAQAKNPWKGSDVLLTKQESPDELYDANNDEGSHSDNSSENLESSSVKRRKANKRLKSRSKEVNSHSTMALIDDKGPSADERSEWASKELLEFVMHMRNGDKSILSQFDVQALLLEYIKRNKLRDPRRKSQIICDARLQNLFGKPRVGHFEMLKLLESHFLLKEDSQTEDQQGSVVDTEFNHLEGDGNIDSYLKTGKDKRRKTRKKSDERGLQSNTDDYAAIDNHNINLIYLRRNLVEELLEDIDKLHDKVVGSFVRIRISGSGQKQDLYRLVQVVGTCKAAEPYKVGKRMTDTLLEILNLNKTEIVSIDIISNQEFTEDECKRLRQSIKCGLINRLTVGDVQDKAMALQAVRVKDWLETEIVRLSHLRDRASEKGRRKELRECVEKLQLLKTPEERQRRLEEIPEIHADPNMDPSYESEEEEETDPKRLESYMRPRGTAFDRRGREMVSPRTGGSNSNDPWSGARNYSNINRELTRNLSNKGLSVKVDDVSNASEVLNDVQMLRGRDREAQLSNSWEGQKLYSSLESSGKSIQPVAASDSLSAAAANASAVTSTTGIASPAVKVNETEKMWHYKDPSGKVQGPFSMAQLRKWNNTGYFPADLRIWRTTEKEDESILLTDALAGRFSNEPSAVDKTFPKAQLVHNLNYAASNTGKLHLPAQQGVDAQVGGRSTFDQSSGSLNSHNAMSSPGQTTGGSWRFEDNNSVANRPSPMTVEIPKVPTNVRGPDVGVRIESMNLPSPTPQTTSYGTKGQAFENKWSPTPVHSAGSLIGSPFPGGHGSLQTPVTAEKVVQSVESLSSSQLARIPAPNPGVPLGHPQATMVAALTADASRHMGADGKTASMQNLAVSDHNSHAEAQGWGSGLVQKPEMAGSIQIRGGEPQAWGGVHSRVESNNLAAMPAQPPLPHGHWADASSMPNAASFNTGNPMGNFHMPGIQDLRPPTSSNQPNTPASLPPSMPWGMTVAENQNTSWGVMPGNPNLNWGGPPAANMNMNWMPGQGPAPGNANPGWAAPSQGPSSVIPTGWVAPGQGHPNANGGWVVPGQGAAPVGANPGWVAPAGGQGMWGNEQNHNGDRFPNNRDRGPHGGESGYGGDKTWNRQSSFGGAGRGGSSSGPPFGVGQRGVCKFHESGHCKKGAFCDYLHT